MASTRSCSRWSICAPTRSTAASACVYAGVAGGKKAADIDERLHNVAAWREAPFYTDAERAALALAEAATRLQGVTDEIWDEATTHFTEEQGRRQRLGQVA